SLVETNLGSILGTAHYMSPEQACGARVDERTDIWSLGVFLYEILTGHAPFSGETPKEVMSSILEKQPPPLSRYVAHAGPELQHIISKTLCKDREERYPSAQQLLEALKEVRRKLEAELERAAPPLWLRWIRSPAILVLFLLVAALAVVLPFYWHPNATRTAPPDKSIAVLPFLDLSQGKNQEYFCDGISEEIINALAKVDGLRVVARTSSFSFKGKNVNASEVG